jgi:hypothetical protein
MERLQNLQIEREGLLEALTALDAYIDEVYMEKDESSECYGHYSTPQGLRMAVDKLKDKLLLCIREIERLTPCKPV